MNCAGIDVSKEHLDIYLPKSGCHQLDYTEAGLEQLVALVETEAVDAVCVEASGGIELPLLRRLFRAGQLLYRLNPARVRDYAKSIGRLEKTDRVDAQVLSHFGAVACQTYPAWQPDCAHLRQLKALWTRRRQLVAARADEKRRRKQAEASMASSFEAVIQVLNDEIARLEAKMDELLDHEELAEHAERLQSVPGVGKLSVIALLAHLPELGQISSKKASKLVGSAPLADDSGKREGQRRTRGGRKEVRNTLYMATLSAIRYNPFIRRFAQRLERAGKHKKVIHVACMNKLVRLLNAMQRDQLMWQQTTAAAA